MLTPFGAAPSDTGTIGEPMREPDVQFWARQFSEHALFFSLGIEDPVMRNAAAALHTSWEQARPGMDVHTALAMCKELRAYKMELFDQLNTGKWLGWIFPTFVDHTRRELDLFVAHATVGTSPGIDCREWLRFMAEHAAFAAHLMDPVEGARIRQAMNFVGRFEALRGECARGVNHQLLALSSRVGKDLDIFVGGQVAKAKSIIHPVLAVHVLREGRRFLYTVDQLRRQA